jgi:hypothetical protein
MKFFVFSFLLSLVSVSAFVVPQSSFGNRLANTTPKTQVNLFDSVPMETISSVQEVASNLMIASKETDFGGYTGPVAGLLTIGALIVVLAPPLSNPDANEAE